ncbi:hypothetical protein S40288_01792 [Stachybotrys chartarum IBT 40288]|nr:hypothetical protein S40288_01792 [Stachybotrys chartarum IBT 40288]
MPYTPPTHRSPASSASASPDASRRPSLQTGSTRPSLPRSASYLNKHRRTPSFSAIGDGAISGPLTPQGTSDDLQAMVAALPSVRQSPPPVTGDRGMPNGAMLSPPESASSGSDDEGPEIRGRKLTNLKDLRDAVNQISLQRETSPPRKDADDATPTQENTAPLHISFSTGTLGDLATLARRASHQRSATESHVKMTKSAENSLTASEEDSEDDLRRKPQMVRKKSGELVRPALRPPSRRRPSSMPGTPVYSKAVHFDSHLEHVRHFLQVDRPLAVSAGSSPVDNYDSDTEYPFPSDQERRNGARSPPYEWEMITPNFPQDTNSRKTLPVRLEKVWLSGDQKSLLGSIAVANIAFHKIVNCRFTLDYWKTTSEVTAEYSHEIRPRETPIGCDRFTFSIKLSDMANLETKTLFFCIRYFVNGQEYWDNNNGSNFQVDFRKKYLPQNGKNRNLGAASRPANGLPRSNRRQNAAGAPRPKSMPAAFNEFGDDEAKFNFDQPIHEYLGETGSGAGGLRLKSRSTNNLASDNLTKDLSSPSGVAFANRYDFGASLSAAVQAAKDSIGKDKDRDALYMKSNVRGSYPQTSPPQAGSPVPGIVPESVPGTSSPVTGLPSASYEELVNKYCFFGSKQSSPTMNDGTLKVGRFDGVEDFSTGSTNSSAGSPQMGNQVNGAAHHAIRMSPQTNMVYDHAVGPSPLRSYTPVSAGSQASTPKASASARSSSPLSNEFPYHTQQVLAERFPWSGEAHGATAILG